MDTKEEAKLWEALDLLTKAEYAIGLVATKAKEKQVYHDFEKAREKIRDAEVLITPLLNLYRNL
jgi:uncharacterized protein YktA (UPF0223 family)